MSKPGMEYRPDYAVPPGETLRETIEALKITQAELAVRAGRPVKTINEIINGKAAITAETALQLERVLDVPAAFWMSLERNYREALAREEESKRIASEVEWLKEIPWRDMEKLGWIEPTDDAVERVRAVLSFFGVATVDAWQELWLNPDATFRLSRAFGESPGNVAAWLRKGEIEAQRLSCGPYSSQAFRSALRRIKDVICTHPESWTSQAQKICAMAGVAVVFVRELPKCPSGATRWLAPDRAVLQLSLRYKTDDHLWFTFFHEAGHLLRHGKREIFVEGSGDGREDRREREADAFAEDFLIPGAHWTRFLRQGTFTADRILLFADEVRVSPGIVVGRLQHEEVIPWRSRLNRLKRRLTWSDS